MKKNCDRVIALLNQALRELGQDFALAPARNNIHTAIKICIDVDRKRSKRDEQNKKLEEQRKLKQEEISKRVAEYWKQKQLEKEIGQGMPDNSEKQF